MKKENNGFAPIGLHLNQDSSVGASYWLPDATERSIKKKERIVFAIFFLHSVASKSEQLRRSAILVAPSVSSEKKNNGGSVKNFNMN
jgi:hypothetical protein